MPRLRLIVDFFSQAAAAWVCAEGLITLLNIIFRPESCYTFIDDMFFSPSLRLKTEAIFAERKGTDKFVEYEFKDYKGLFSFL